MSSEKWRNETAVVSTDDGWEREETIERQMSVKVDVNDVDLLAADIIQGREVRFSNGAIRDFTVISTVKVLHVRKKA